MTLVLTINGPETNWMVADRRLSYSNRAPKDDARKMMVLEAEDGVAILGYAGLGATAKGTEPADWMSNVLRGRKLPLETCLGVLAKAMKDQLPKHLVGLPGKGAPAHNLIAPAIVGGEVKLYTIDFAFSENRKEYRFRYTRHVTSNSIDQPRQRTPRIGLGGTGAIYLSKHRHWIRNLLRKANAVDKKQLSPNAVAKQLAEINYEVHTNTADGSVGPNCIVAWRHRKEGIHGGGGGHQYFSDTDKEANSPSLPSIANGMDLRALINVLMPKFMESVGNLAPGERPPELDKDALNKELRKLPDEPDEKLE